MNGKQTNPHPYYFVPVPTHPEAPPSKWTKFYWPAALAVAAALFLGELVFHIGHPGIALWIGAVILAGPEITVAALGQWQNTLSEWVWSTLRITQGQPFGNWRASHLLALIGYLVLASTVCVYMATHEAVGWTVLACGLSAWLTFHFFWHKFT
jgi:hypothetical protein